MVRALKKEGSIFIGTSGWYYPHWNEVFYPKELKTTERLPFYAEHFDTVEINTTFYHLPKNTTVKNWDLQVAKDFHFSIKASQYITHRKRLKECRESVKIFFQRIKHLENKMGVILFQLPPSFKINYERLEEFLGYLDHKHRYTFEFRHPSWYTEEIYQLLSQHGIAICITDLGGVLSPIVTTADFAYIRLHGPHDKYEGFYGTKRLQTWKKRILEFKQQGISTYCYFDNDDKGYAVQDALKLKQMF